MTIDGNTLGDAILAERARGGRSYSADTKARVRAEAGEIADAVNTEVAAAVNNAFGLYPTPAPTALGDVTGGVVLTSAQLLTGLLTADPSAGGDAALTLPDADLLVAALTTALGRAAAVGDSLKFHLINLSTTVADTLTLTGGGGTGATIVGQPVIEERDAVASRSEALFMARLTNVGAATEAYDVYRLA